MAPGVRTPSVQAKRQDLRNLLIAQRLNLRRRDQLLLKGRLGHGPLHITPDEGAVLGEIVALLAPGSVATACGRGLSQSEVEVAEILDVDLVPDVLALADKDTLLCLEDGRGEGVGLDTAGVAGSTAGSVDAGRADDGRLHAFGRGLSGSEDDLVNITVEGIVGEGSDFANAVPVIVLLGAIDTKGLGALVLPGQDASSRGVDEPDRVLLGVVADALCDGICGGDVVTVREVW